MSKREVKLYIEDIKECIQKIERYIEGMSFDTFTHNTMAVDAVIRNIEIIGEAVANIPDEVKEQCPDVPWYEIKGMRNRIVHEYFGVDEKILWDTIKNNLPKLKEQIEKMTV